MLQALLVSTVLSWVVILLLGVALLALARQVGVLPVSYAHLTLPTNREVENQVGPATSQT